MCNLSTHSVLAPYREKALDLRVQPGIYSRPPPPCLLAAATVSAHHPGGEKGQSQSTTSNRSFIHSHLEGTVVSSRLSLRALLSEAALPDHHRRRPNVVPSVHNSETKTCHASPTSPPRLALLCRSARPRAKRLICFKLPSVPLACYYLQLEKRPAAKDFNFSRRGNIKHPGVRKTTVKSWDKHATAPHLIPPYCQSRSHSSSIGFACTPRTILLATGPSLGYHPESHKTFDDVTPSHMPKLRLCEACLPLHSTQGFSEPRCVGSRPHIYTRDIRAAIVLDSECFGYHQLLHLPSGDQTGAKFVRRHISAAGHGGAGSKAGVRFPASFESLGFDFLLSFPSPPPLLNLGLLPATSPTCTSLTSGFRRQVVIRGRENQSMRWSEADDHLGSPRRSLAPMFTARSPPVP